LASEQELSRKLTGEGFRTDTEISGFILFLSIISMSYTGMKFTRLRITTTSKVKMMHLWSI
jgi:hypothetical protein